MNTMTDLRKQEAGEVEKIVAPNGNGAAKPKSDPKLAVPKICYWHELFRENSSSMDQGAIVSFRETYGCDNCEGYKAKCGGKA